MQELLLKLMDDLQILIGSQQEKKETTAQSFTPYWDFSMIDDEEARDNFLKDVCTFLRKFSRIPFGVTPKNRPTYYDNDDDEYTIIYSKPKAITPDLPIEEPDNSLSMGDKHLDTIPSVKKLVPIPSELEGISNDTCDMAVCEDPSTFDALNDHSEILSDSNNDGTSSDERSYEKNRITLKHPTLLSIWSTIVKPDQGGLISIVISDISNDPLLEFPEFESFHFDPSFPRPPPDSPDVKISLIIETDAPVINNFDELNEDECFDPRGDEPNCLKSSRVLVFCPRSTRLPSFCLTT
ncbi:hypothetical protein Tco_0590426 [Tanacetum coccineum]